jgi:hypothetical protein
VHGNAFSATGQSVSLLYVLLCSVVALVLGVVVIFSDRKAEVPWTATLAVVVGGGFTALGALVVLVASMMGAPGRPVRVAGIPWLPRVRRAYGGRDDAPRAHPLVRMPSSQTRSVLTKLWIADARAEHASIAAFERLAAELDLLGAPAALIQWAKRAAREEDGHARACLELAAAYGGVAVDVVPSRSALSSPRFTKPGSSARRRVLLTRMPVESLLEGSVGEGLAAKVAREGSICAREVPLASILDQVAREEESHASLARAILAWCVGEDPSSVPVLRWALGRSRRHRAAVVTGDDLRAFGRLDSARVAELAHSAHEEAERHLQSIRAASQSPDTAFP